MEIKTPKEIAETLIEFIKAVDTTKIPETIDGEKVIHLSLSASNSGYAKYANASFYTGKRSYTATFHAGEFSTYSVEYDS